MRTILAIAALIAVSACQGGGGYDGPYPFGPIWTPPQPAYQPMYRQPLMCGQVGTMVHCY
jgi:hypothetical protein